MARIHGSRKPLGRLSSLASSHLDRSRAERVRFENLPHDVRPLGMPAPHQGSRPET
jgi:hypothetical protein